MAGVASKNLYDLLGNDPDQDPELRSEVPLVIPVEKASTRKGKRDAPTEAPAAPVAAASAGGEARGRGGRGRGGRGGGRGRGRGGYADYGGNEDAFHDTDAGRARNREKPTDEMPDRRGRGRGGRARGTRLDRHSGTVHPGGPNDQAKQAAQGWGANTGESEWADERAGDAIAEQEQQQGFEPVEALDDKPVNAEGETPITEQAEREPEAEDKTKSYSDYLAEQAEKKLQLGGALKPRMANEGSKKDLPEGKELEKDAGGEYFAGSSIKGRRERERKEKNTLLLDHDFQAREQPVPRGGRGGPRGGRGRGEGRGRGFGGRGRGEYRGRGGRGGSSVAPGAPAATGPSPNVANPSDFPTLGS